MKTARRIFSAMIVAVLLISCFAVTSFAAGEIAISSVKLVKGSEQSDSITVDVEFSATAGTDQITVLMSTESIAQVTEQNASKVLYIDQFKNPENGTCSFTVSKASIAEAAGTEEIDGTTLYLKMGGTGVQTAAATTVTYVENVGDANRDEEVNAKDVTVIRRSIAGGYGVTVNEAAADVNRDGAINAKDLTVLRRYLAGGYGVTL